MNQLVPCPSCSRHTQRCETLCPFCGVTLPTCKERAAAAAANPGGRLSRATLIAAGAVLLTGAACTDNNTLAPYGAPPPPPKSDAGADAKDSDAAKTDGKADAGGDGKAPQSDADKDGHG